MGSNPIPSMLFMEMCISKQITFDSLSASTNILSEYELAVAVEKKELSLELEKFYSITKAHTSTFFNSLKNMTSANIQNANINSFKFL